MINTAIIGATGFIGTHFFSEYRRVSPECIGTAFSNIRPDLIFFDIRNPDITQLNLEETNHKEVLICSGMTNVEYCENNPDESYEVNVRGTLKLIRQLEKCSIKVNFFSSDYVFDGKCGFYDDNAETLPTTEYGRQKVRVEKEIPNLTDNYLIVRISKIVDKEKDDETLLNKIARDLKAGKVIKVAKDQFFNPTYIYDLFCAFTVVQEKHLNGVINIASPSRISRFEVARSIAVSMGVNLDLLQTINLYDIPSMVGRPLDTSLNCTKLKRLGFNFTPLDELIHVVAKNWS